MTTEPARSTVSALLEIFDVKADGPDRFTGQTSMAGAEERQIVEGAQILGQAIVAAAKRFPGKSIRSVHGVFARAVLAGPPVEFDADVISEGRSTATTVITATQNAKRCMTFTVFADVPTPDVIRHHLPRPRTAPPLDAHVFDLPMAGREVRIVDVVDIHSPDEVGEPEIYAWVNYDAVPSRDDLAKALVADFTGHLGIATTMRAHAGIGTRQSHLTISTAPMTLTVNFHEPVSWNGWLLYSHESTQAGAGMSYIRGTVHTEQGGLLASFSQESIIRPLRSSDATIATTARL
jgi:acyl-CoA thioesterase-2